jgi:1-acyl-sn-glycerol-3-phosphate acyltransferase
MSKGPTATKASSPGSIVRALSVGRVARKLRGAGLPWQAPDWPTSVPRPAPERELGADYDTTWARKYPVRVARAMVIDNVARPLVHALASPQVRGDELLSLTDQPVILVANHASHIDTGLLISALPSRIRHSTVVAGAADYFFDRRWKAHTWAFLTAAIPMERQRVNRKSAQLAIDLIDEGWNLLIYPEGGRSPDGWMQEFRAGAAYLAVRTGRPVIPIHMDGTWRVLPRHGGKLRRTPTTITFGLPLHPDEGEDARRFSVRLEKAVELLALERTSDWWSARKAVAAGTETNVRGPSGSTWRRAWALGDAPRRVLGEPGGDWALKDRVRS